MKTVKFTISFFLLFTGMMIISESHVFYLNDFYTPFDHTTLYLQPNTTEKEMIHDIIDSANRNHVEVFTYASSPRTTFLTEFDIYGTTGVQPYIKRHLNISEKNTKAYFLKIWCSIFAI